MPPVSRARRPPPAHRREQGMTCHFGEGVIVCDGRSSQGWRVSFAWCPWCCLPGDKPVRVLAVDIFGGWGGSDLICGTCGQFWSNDGENHYRRMTEDQRDENIARVVAVPDPNCWDCHDTGDKSRPWDEEAIPCECASPTTEDQKG